MEDNIYSDGTYLVNNPTWDQEDSLWKANKILEAFRRNALFPQSIVDVGCGAGGVLSELKKKFPSMNCQGFDIAPDARRFWDKYRSDGLSFEVADFLTVGKGSHYDCLLLLDVIEHLPDPFVFLNALRSRADHFIFHIPLDLSASSVLREEPLLYVRHKVGHVQYYTKKLALSLLKESGFSVLDCFYTEAYLAGLGTSFKKRLAMLPRKLVFSLNHDVGARLLGGETIIVVAKA